MRKGFPAGGKVCGFSASRRRWGGAAWFFPLKWLHPPEFVQI